MGIKEVQGRMTRSMEYWHWEIKKKKAYDNKRNPYDFARWKDWAKIGNQAEQFMISEQAKILEVFKGKGSLEPIEDDAVTLWVGSWKEAIMQKLKNMNIVQVGKATLLIIAWTSACV